ncbi:MAG TPA: glycosyltransferase family 4 protein [Chloroflexaceae bacterium]|nr:glycosyltransferase family 4 protein [Chloroflexaceae bacterium]
MTQLQHAEIHAEDVQLKTILLVGGSLDRQRREATRFGEKPRVDMLEVEAQSEAQIRDYSWLRERGAHEPLTRLFAGLADRIGLWHFWLALRVLVDLRNVGVIYATGEDVGIAMAILLRLTGQGGPRLVMRIEEPVYGRTALRRAIIRAIVSFGLKRIDLILTRTHAHVERLQSEFGVPAERLRFVADTVDTEFFSPHTLPAPQLVEGIARPYILSAGLELRDYRTLVEAVRGLPIQVVIAASSPWSTYGFGLTREEIPDNVRVEKYTPRQMRELFRSAALVVVPVVPTKRSCGISVVLESMAMRRPVVAAHTEGLASYLEDGVNAATFPPGDAAALRRRLVELLENPALAERIGERGYACVLRHHRLQNLTNTLHSVIATMGDRAWVARQA